MARKNKGRDIVYKGEVLPPEQQSRHGLVRPDIPETGAVFFPLLRLNALRKVWSAYGSYLAEVERIQEANARLYRAVIDNRRALQEFDRIDEILEEDELDWQEKRKTNAHKREMSRRKREAEFSGFDAKQEMKALKREAEREELNLRIANASLSKRAIDAGIQETAMRTIIASRETIGKASVEASAQYDEMYNALISKRGGEANFTAQEKQLLAQAKEAKRELDDVLKDFDNG